MDGCQYCYHSLEKNIKCKSYIDNRYVCSSYYLHWCKRLLICQWMCANSIIRYKCTVIIWILAINMKTIAILFIVLGVALANSQNSKVCTIQSSTKNFVKLFWFRQIINLHLGCGLCKLQKRHHWSYKGLWGYSQYFPMHWGHISITWTMYSKYKIPKPITEKKKKN